VRAFRAVGGEPFFVDRAQGRTSGTSTEMNTYDYVGTWGPAILGHAHPRIVRAVREAAERGTSFGHS
jgi:glutamate-1-semialdehyde 2,1-aminomutase